MTRRRRNVLMFFLGCSLGALLWWLWKTPGARPERVEPGATNRADEAKRTAARTAAGAAPTAADLELGEVIWRVRGDAARAHLERALAAGLLEVGSLDALDLVLLAGPRGLLATWSAEAEMLGFNLPLRLPPPPATDLGGSASAPFRQNALRYLGLADRPAAWGERVRLAVLDTGLGAHPAFASAKITRVGGVDATLDDHGHGTGVAALLVGQDSIAAGIAPGAELLVYKVLDGDGVGDAFTTAAAIVSAVDRGAQVINLSAGSSEDAAVLREAADYAASRGVILVAAVGNDGDHAVHYPAAYDSVVAVGAIDANGQAAAFSNRGAAVDLVAPGTGLYTAYPGDQYMDFSGTSAAAPLVSASIAALLSEEPLLSATQVVAELTARADDLHAPGVDEATGAGLINPNRVLERHELNLADLAVATPLLLPPADDTSDYIVSLNAQNRGNLYLASPAVLLEVDGRSLVERVNGLSPGESAAVTFTVPREALTSEAGVSVSVETILGHGQSDARSENDGYTTTLRLDAPGP